MSKSLIYEVINKQFVLKDALNATLGYGNIKSVRQDSNKIVDYTKLYLTLACTKAGTIDFSEYGKQDMLYSLDGGKTWNDCPTDSVIATLAVGKRISFKGNITPKTSGGAAAYNTRGPGYFSGTAEFNAEGNPLSIIDSEHFAEISSLSNQEFTLAYMFNESNVISAKNLKLIPTILGPHCYHGIFIACSKLIETPELPATTLAICCYESMFYRCSSLTSAPALPANTLASYCYDAMFGYCTSLTKGPDLPAKNLGWGCYDNMFAYCSNLNYVKVLFDELPITDDETPIASNYLATWLTSVAPTGKLVLSDLALWRPEINSDSGCPNGWTWEFVDGTKEMSYNDIYYDSQLFNWNNVTDIYIAKDRTCFYSTEEEEAWSEPGGFPDPPPERAVTITVGSSTCTLHFDGTTSKHYYMDGAISTATDFVWDWDMFISEIRPLIKEFIMRGIPNGQYPSVSGDNEYAINTFGEQLKFKVRQ